MRIETDKGIYRPGEVAQCYTDSTWKDGKLRLTLYHAETAVAVKETETRKHAFSFQLPEKDGQGYLLKAESLDENGRVTDRAFAALDCSGDWTRFPRYGYIWDYRAEAEPEDKIRALNRYHLNGLQFYDWQYRHHIPVAPDLREWDDWSGRKISGAIQHRYIEQAHAAGMVCMAYNMIYAANMTYLTDGSGVSPEWRLVKQDGTDFTCDMNAELGPVGILQYFNPLNRKWQDYIFAKEREVLERLGFDGWHGDTIGEMGPMMTADGSPLGYSPDGEKIECVKDCYTPFLNAAKDAISPGYLAFNPVGAQGIENVNKSHADVLYTEFWPWDRDDRGALYDDYYSIHRAILNAAEQSGGKSLIVAGYINYKNPSEWFNEPAVRLMDSVVFASGGSRIELGNGDGMLSNEYFPDDRHKKMDPETRLAVERLYDFVTAYENLLRDGQTNVQRATEIPGITVSETGRSNTVWHFCRMDATYEIHHFINLIGTDNEWRDVEQRKPAPKKQNRLTVRIRTEREVHTVYLASPDREDLLPVKVDHVWGRDEKSAYIQFEMDELVYWNMVFLR